MLWEPEPNIVSVDCLVCVLPLFYLQFYWETCGHFRVFLQMLLQFEKELAQAVEALTKEQEKAAQAEREKQTQVNVFLFSQGELLQIYDKQKEECQFLSQRTSGIDSLPLCLTVS